MNRRKFIQITGLSLGSVALSSSIISCAPAEAEELYGWNGPDNQTQDIRLKVLAYAILSPNPHNKQPWIIRFTGTHSFDLYVDRERLLPATDPYYRQIHIGQGTFLETLNIAAGGLGFKAAIQYFPLGMYSNTELLSKPVASVELIKSPDIQVDPLFKHLLNRHSNKQEYDNQKLSIQQIESLHDFHWQDNKSRLTIKNNDESKQQLEKILTQAMQIETGHPDRDRETIEMFRFNDQEVKQHRDGFGVSQVGMTGLKKILIERFMLSRESVEKDPSAFGAQAVEMTQKTAASTATFGWLSTATNTRLDQVKTGRDYTRINLKITAMGLAMHPMSQVLQEYDDMISLQKSFKKVFNINQQDTVQMLFRLGKAEATAHGPRRLVSQLIKS